MKVNLEVYLSVLGNSHERVLSTNLNILLRFELLCKCTFKHILFNVFTMYVMLKIRGSFGKGKLLCYSPPQKNKKMLPSDLLIWFIFPDLGTHLYVRSPPVYYSELIGIIMKAGELDPIWKSWSKCGPDARKMCFIIYSASTSFCLSTSLRWILILHPQTRANISTMGSRLQEPIKLCCTLK